MQHANQHIEAINKTLAAKVEVSASFFDDKVRDAGSVVVSRGKITVTVHSLPGMTANEATASFLGEAIGLSIAACYLKCPEAFEIT